MNKATLRLFNAIQVDNKDEKAISQEVYARTIKNGYVLSPAITPTDSLLTKIERIVGISGEKANAAFHKSWSVIQNCDIEALVMQQIIHYITTYGFKDLGIFSDDAVYIPNEKLDIPEVRDDIPLTMVKAMDADDVLAGIKKLGSGVALGQETLDDIMLIIEANNYDNQFVSEIKNRELKALLEDYYGIIPSEPVAYLRYVISNLTDQAMLIKSDALIEKIKASNGKFLDRLIEDAPDDLASIFFRYKPLFLAMKSISRKKTFFNQLRKKADSMHKPLPEDYLNSITRQVKHGVLDLGYLHVRLKKASIFRKIRLAYALKFRLHSEDSIVYRVRNGRGWATNFDWPTALEEQTQQALDVVLGSIVDSLRPNLEGKTFYIPENVHYTLPATEKQFTGNLPSGSAVTVPEDLIVGIHWFNTDKQVDLDLSMIGQSGKTGWDANYRSDKKSILFSGDVTNAPKPKGAAEMFYIKKGLKEPKLLMLNYYNFSQGDEVEAKLFTAYEKPKKFGSNYMVDVNNIIASSNMNISKKQNILGLVVNVSGQNRVCFANTSVGNAISSRNNEQSTHVRHYLVQSMLNTIDLRQILVRSGAIDVASKDDDVDFDLSPEGLDKTAILNILQSNN